MLIYSQHKVALDLISYSAAYFTLGKIYIMREIKFERHERYNWRSKISLPWKRDMSRKGGTFPTETMTQIPEISTFLPYRKQNHHYFHKKAEKNSDLWLQSWIINSKKKCYLHTYLHYLQYARHTPTSILQYQHWWSVKAHKSHHWVVQSLSHTHTHHHHQYHHHHVMLNATHP